MFQPSTENADKLLTFSIKDTKEHIKMFQIPVKVIGLT